MPERDPSEYRQEDLKAVEEYINRPIHQVKRKPFKPYLMMGALFGVVIFLGGLAWLICWLVEPYL